MANFQRFCRQSPIDRRLRTVQ